MAIQIRPVSLAVQKSITFYMEEIRKIDPDIIIETEDWCMNFKNRNEVNLFYFTFSDPLSFRIKVMSEDSTYDYMTEDSPRNRKEILERIRALIFESYMNRKGLVAKMTPEMRRFILRTMEQNEIARYTDEDDAFTALINDIPIYKFGYNKKDKTFSITLPQHIFKENDEDILVTYNFVEKNYDTIANHLIYSSFFYKNYNHANIIQFLQKVRDFLKFTYKDNFKELNEDHKIVFKNGMLDILSFEVRKNGTIGINYFVNEELRDKTYNSASILKVFNLIDDEFVNLELKVEDAFYQDQQDLYNEMVAAIDEYDRHIEIVNLERSIEMKDPYGAETPFAIIRRRKDLENEIVINGKVIKFTPAYKKEIFEYIFDYLVNKDNRVAPLIARIDEINQNEDLHEGHLQDAKVILEEFEKLHPLLKSKYSDLKEKIEKTIDTINRFIEDKKKADAALAAANESYSRLLSKLNDLYGELDLLKQRVKTLETKVDELELKNKGKQ